jgi:hypothetical protein
MNLDLSETQQLLQSTVRDFLERELPFERVRKLEAPQSLGRLDEVLWKEISRQGWLGLGFSEAHGGSDSPLVDVGLLVEELARRAAIVPALETLVAGRALERFASAEVAAEWVPGSRRKRRGRAGPLRGQRHRRGAHRGGGCRGTAARREGLRRLCAEREPPPRSHAGGGGALRECPGPAGRRRRGAGRDASARPCARGDPVRGKHGAGPRHDDRLRLRARAVRQADRQLPGRAAPRGRKRSQVG